MRRKFYVEYMERKDGRLQVKTGQFVTDMDVKDYRSIQTMENYIALKNEAEYVNITEICEVN